MAATFSRIISNNLAALQRLLQEASTFLESENLETLVPAVELILEELITNTIKYGYDDKAEHPIEVQIGLKEDSIHVAITDGGHEFDPLAAAPPDLSQPVEERGIGGLGIHLVRRMTTSIKYKRLHGKNVLELAIAIPTLPK
jgi:anti-sigma regulatory factor (Ser/Thr protein kinase)